MRRFIEWLMFWRRTEEKANERMRETTAELARGIEKESELLKMTALRSADARGRRRGLRLALVRAEEACSMSSPPTQESWERAMNLADPKRRGADKNPKGKS